MENSKKVLLRELFLYGIIGGTTALADILLFQLFRIAGVPLLIANFLSVSIAIGSSFILNARFNFRKTNDLARRAIKFFSIGYLGLFIQAGILWVGVDILGSKEIYTKVIAVIIVAAIQYVLNKFLTFRN